MSVFKLAFYLIKLHLNQVVRLMKEIGVLRVIILLIFIFITISKALPVLNENPNFYFLISLPVLFLSYYFKGEIEFLRINFQNQELIRLCRNLLILSPLLIWLIIKLQFLQVFLIVTLTFIFSFIKTFNSFDSNIKIHIPLKLLNWKTEIRRYFLLILLLELLSLGIIYHFSILMITMILLHILVLSFLNNNENHLSLESANLKANVYVRYYSFNHMLYFAILSLPLILMTALLSIDQFIIVLILFVVLTFHQFLSVLMKLSFYSPGKSNEGMQVIQWLMLIFLLIPFAFLIPIWYIFIYYKRARTNLKPFLG